LNLIANEKVSCFLFSILTRLGRLAETDLGNRTANVEQLPEEQLELVEYVDENPGDSGHNYFRTNPASPSDLVLMARYDCSAGRSQSGPLDHLGGEFLKINNDYLTEIIE
tara:strand:+ start:21 stop:350 length:330 start_codon:yes stop_codon:yes gene_type:complete